jgi:thiamine biosynthesis lipoprotein
MAARMVTRPRVRHDFTVVAMDTLVNVQVVSDQPASLVEATVRRGLEWFDLVERVCTRFDPRSEVMQLIDRVGRATKVSPLLFEVVTFALSLAEQTDGAFDPTVGAAMEQLGFDTHYRTGEKVHSDVAPGPTSFHDVAIDRRHRAVTLRRRLVLDLNAVSKGLAIDLAARELEAYPDFFIEAGGDVCVRGHSAAGEPWHVGIQHPRADGLLTRTLQQTRAAICTSGDYERRAPNANGSGHILDGRTRQAVSDLASVTVVAPTAMAADGLSTAAMVLGRERGLRFLEEQGVGGLLVAPDGSSVSVNL